jgi:hypothetical protein
MGDGIMSLRNHAHGTVSIVVVYGNAAHTALIYISR